MDKATNGFEDTFGRIVLSEQAGHRWNTVYHFVAFPCLLPIGIKIHSEMDFLLIKNEILFS